METNEFCLFFPKLLRVLGMIGIIQQKSKIKWAQKRTKLLSRMPSCYLMGDRWRLWSEESWVYIPPEKNSDRVWKCSEHDTSLLKM
jgi:hypothetical protein